MQSLGKAPPNRLGSLPSHSCSAPVLSTLGQRGVAAITFPVRCPRCVFAWGQGDAHPRPPITHTPLPRVEARAEVSQGSEDAALPLLALGKVSGFFYSTSRFIADGDGSRTRGGKAGPRGRPPGTGKQRVTPAVAGAPGRAGSAPASCPRAPGRARRGLARCRGGQGHRRVHRAPCPAPCLRLCLPVSGARGPPRDSQSEPTRRRARPAHGGSYSLAGDRPGWGSVAVGGAAAKRTGKGSLALALPHPPQPVGPARGFP